MDSLPESTINILIGGLLTALGSLISIPTHEYFSWRMKRSELLLQHQLEINRKERELYLQHKLELKRENIGSNELHDLKDAIKQLDERLKRTEDRYGK